jgi:hypothetical protein
MLHTNWIKDLNIKHKTIKLLEETFKENLLNIGLGNDLLNMSSKVQVTKEKWMNWTSSKLKAHIKIMKR